LAQSQGGLKLTAILLALLIYFLRKHGRFSQIPVNFKALIITISVLGGAVLLGIAVCCCYCCRRKKSRKADKSDERAMREQEERRARQEERRAEMKSRHDEIRKKYGKHGCAY
uniref:Pituitary tumor-transforming 1 interacting protein n=1 Tax=Jaculus jaculus TaxID=51337 RepID=A0A8C5KB83_JACJA